MQGVPFTGAHCALVRNLKMLKGTGFTSNLIQKLRRGCVCVCVCVCVRVCMCVYAHACAYSVMSNSATPRSVACQAPLSVGYFQARILEWVAISFARGSSRPRDQTRVSCTVGRFVTGWATRETLQINATVLYALLSAQSSSRVNMLYSPAQQLMFSCPN